MGHESLRNYYLSNFALMEHHHYSLSDLEEMLPFEREVYISLVSAYVEEENAKRKQEQENANRR